MDNKENVIPTSPEFVSGEEEQEVEDGHHVEPAMQPGELLVLIPPPSPPPPPSVLRSVSQLPASQAGPRELAGPEEVATYLGPNYECEIVRLGPTGEGKVSRVRITPPTAVSTRPAETMILIADVVCDLVQAVLDEYTEPIVFWMLAFVRLSGVNGHVRTLTISTTVGNLCSTADVPTQVLHNMAKISDEFDALRCDVIIPMHCSLKRIELDFMAL